MPLAKITGPGLLAIACAVSLLWACLVGERTMMRRAWAERAAVMKGIELQQDKRRTRPAGVRSIRPTRPERPIAG